MNIRKHIIGLNAIAIVLTMMLSGCRMEVNDEVAVSHPTASDDLLGDWYTVDVKLNKRFFLGRYVLQATLECNNLTDSHHEVVKRYPMPGRNYKMTLKFEL